MKELKEIRAAGICGSLRKESFNLKLLDLACRMSASAGVAVERLDLNSFNLPLYNYDIETVGLPEGVQRLAQALLPVDVLFIASPEHDYSITAALKNAIDWLTRVKPMPLSDKIAVIFGASTGPMGTARGQLHLRYVLTGANMLLLPQPQVFVANAESAFEASGSLAVKQVEENLRKLVQNSLQFASKVR